MTPILEHFKEKFTPSPMLIIIIFLIICIALLLHKFPF